MDTDNNMGVPSELVQRHVKQAMLCFNDALQAVGGTALEDTGDTDPVDLSAYVPKDRIPEFLRTARAMAVERGLNIQPRLEPMETSEVRTDIDAIHYLMVEHVTP